MLEDIRNRLRVEISKKDDFKNNIKQQSKITFNGFHKSNENCDSYRFKQKEVTRDKPIRVGFAILELSRLYLYETYYDKLQPYFGQQNLQLHYIDTDGMTLSMKTQNIIKDWKNLEDTYDFSYLDANHEIFDYKN